MGRYIQKIVFEPDHEYVNEADKAVDELSGLVLYMREYYENIFSGLDEVIKACNQKAEG